VIVSADVLVADTASEAERLGRGYAEWVHSIRAGQGAIAYPRPEDALVEPFEPDLLDVVADRLDTRFVGDPDAVAERLATLQRVTGADELLVTTIAHDPRDRVRSFELLAEVWGLKADVEPALEVARS
jgi:alkanesulfonate monooxygenase SsuD/methylene tetrahydromethanopterin reductase-like flavin-dependent oxidoreductase (luciferase family)